MRVARPLYAFLLVAPMFAGSLGCSSGTRMPDLVTRMATARTTAESFGYAANGTPVNGLLEDGKEARVPIALKDGCYQVYVFPADGLKGIDVSVVDGSGKAIGTVTKLDSHSAVKLCTEPDASYSLVVKSLGGSGGFLAQPYISGEKPAGDGSAVGIGVIGPEGDPVDDSDPCSAGIDLPSTGSTHGTLAKSSGSIHWSCGAADGPATIYRVHVDGRHKLTVDLNAKFDAVMAIYRSDTEGRLCESSNELDCSDDAEGLVGRSHVETIVDTGDYGIVIGGYDATEVGKVTAEFDVRTKLEDAPTIESICNAATAITAGTPISDNLMTNASNFHASCGSSDGDDLLYKFDLKSKSRVRASMRASTGDQILSIRSKCEDSATEVACTNTSHFGNIGWTGTLNAGSYSLISDVNDSSHSASVDLTLDTAPERGSGVDGDTCKDAKPLPMTTFTVDTFLAKPDVKTSCAGEAASDVVYKLDIKSKSRFTLNAAEDEGRHVIAVQKTCGETKGEAACETATGKGVETTLEPGSYFVVVKGKSESDFGRVRLTPRIRDLAGAEGACKAAPKLLPGKPVTDTTKDQPDRFISTTCGGGSSIQTSGDKVYQFTLPKKAKVNLSLKGSTFYNAIMSLRSDCKDPTKGEIVCSNTYSKLIDRELDAGTYFVVVDGYGVKSEGAFTLELTVK